jgi:hypothetical protein
MVRRRIKIKPGQSVSVAFTARERPLVTEHTFAGPDLTDPLQTARLSRGKYRVRYDLDDIDELLGYVAAEANHATSKRLQKKLYGLFNRLQSEMESYDDGLWPNSGANANQLKKPATKPRAKLSVIKGGKKP